MTVAETNPRRCFQIEKDITIGTYDIDFAGHVSNLVYLRWMEDMRLAVFEKHFPLKGFVDAGLLPVIASTKIEYKRAIRLFDRPKGYMSIIEVRPASVVFEGEVRVDGHVATVATHVGAFIRQDNHRPVRVPKVILEKFELERAGCASQRM